MSSDLDQRSFTVYLAAGAAPSSSAVKHCLSQPTVTVLLPLFTMASAKLRQHSKHSVREEDRVLTDTRSSMPVISTQLKIFAMEFRTSCHQPVGAPRHSCS